MLTAFYILIFLNPVTPIDRLWDSIKHRNYYDQYPQIQEVDSSYYKYNLILANYYLKSDKQNESLAFRNFLKAWDKSILKDHKLDSSKEIIKYSLFVHKDTSLILKWINRYEKLCSRSKDYAWYDYFTLRYKVIKAYTQNTSPEIDPKEIQDLLKHCRKEKYKRLIVEILSFKAVLETYYNCNFETALINNKQALELAESIDPILSKEIFFSSHANIGFAYMNELDYEQALKFLKIAESGDLNYQRLQNHVKLYSWMSECYATAHKVDSAYLYLSKSFQAYKKNSELNHASEIKHIVEKYQNKKLTKELIEESLKNNKLLYGSITLGGLLILSLFGLWVIRRINKLKQYTLEKEIVETHQKGQLAAINAQLDGETEERKRVATVLHDGISSHLTAASFHLQFLASSIENKSLTKASKLIDEAAERSRKLSHELYPPVLIKNGLIVAIDALLQSYSNESLQLVLECDKDFQRLSSLVESKLYYVICEILQNVIKHSRANNCNIKIYRNLEYIILEIKDNGIGISVNSSQVGLGLSSIHSRVNSMNGQLHHSSNIPSGLISTIRIPYSYL